MAEQSVILAPGESKVVAFEVSPSEARAYHVEVNGLSGSFVATEAPELVTFSVRVSDIPSYAADAYQWFILYGGQNWGMIDPQGGVWTPIDEPITVTGPAMGTLSATLHAGPFKSWEFRAGRKFESGKEYTFQLAAGILASGIALTNLTVEPDFIYLGDGSITISVTAVNTETEEQSYEVVFKVEGVNVATETISLGPMETREVSATYTPTQEGRFKVTVETLYAWLDVKGPYPDITEPSLESFEVLPESEWERKSPHSIAPKFKGEMLLPRLGENQGYGLSIKGAGLWQPLVGAATIEYLSNGRWGFEGSAAAGYLGSQNICTDYIKYWQALDPVRRQEVVRSEPCYESRGEEPDPADREVVRAKMQASLDATCQRYYNLWIQGDLDYWDKRYCVTFPLSSVTLERVPTPVTSWYACPGTTLPVTLVLTLWDWTRYPYGGGADIASEWEFPTRLRLVSTWSGIKVYY